MASCCLPDNQLFGEVQRGSGRRGGDPRAETQDGPSDTGAARAEDHGGPRCPGGESIRPEFNDEGSGGESLRPERGWGRDPRRPENGPGDDTSRPEVPEKGSGGDPRRRKFLNTGSSGEPRRPELAERRGPKRAWAEIALYVCVVELRSSGTKPGLGLSPPCGDRIFHPHGRIAHPAIRHGMLIRLCVCVCHLGPSTSNGVSCDLVVLRMSLLDSLIVEQRFVATAESRRRERTEQTCMYGL